MATEQGEPVGPDEGEDVPQSLPATGAAGAAVTDGAEATMGGDAPEGLHPDHPLLARAQAALKKQLLANRTRLEEELREKQNALKMAKSKRENIGVELYGFQQGLAKLQMQLEATHQNYLLINKTRAQVEDQLAQLRQHLGSDDTDTKRERARVEKHQLELDRLAATLKQIEAYNEEMKSEIAVTRRAAYAAEGAVQKLEREKLEQDLRIDTMQENLKALQQQLALHTAQLEAQKRETRAALETLAEAEGEMESVHFEKKQLVAQWKGSLMAIQKRDEALSAIQIAMREQQQQELSIESEIQGYKKDIIKQQINNEALTAVLKKVEAESQFVSKQIETMVEKQSKLQEVFAKLAKSLEHTEAQVVRMLADHKALVNEQQAVDRANTKVTTEIRQIEEEMLLTLSDQTTAEKSSSKTSKDVTELRKRIRAEELESVEVQNELAKLQVDILNTEAHNVRLADTLKLLDEEISEKAGSIEKYEVEVKRRNDDIEKKTREIDHLNRKLERMVNNMVDEETGPLEAVIRNLQREIDTKGVESQELQRRWIVYQTELVQLQNDNSSLTETVARLRAEHTVLFQKRRRLEAQLEDQNKELKALQGGMVRLNVDLQRVNGLIAQNSSAREALKEDNFNLETKIMSELKDLEEQAAHTSSLIDMERATKRDVLAEVVEVERQIMLWERKILLEKEMQEVLDPTVGQDVVGEMRREIHRMELRHGELMRLQEKLMQDLEKALSKRDVISVKGRATQARSKTTADTALTRQQLDKATVDLSRSVKDTEKEIQVTTQRLQELEAQRGQLQAELVQVDSSCVGLRDQEEVIKQELGNALALKYQALLATARQQKRAKRLEDMEAGRHKPLLEDPSQLDSELSRARERLGRVVSLLQDLKGAAPEVGVELDKVLAHVAQL